MSTYPLNQTPPREPDQLIELLRAQSDRLGLLEDKLNELENAHSSLGHVNKKLQQELKRVKTAKDEWEWFFEHSLDMLCIADLHGYFKRVNKSFTHNLGYTKRELLSRPFIEFVHPDDRERTIAEYHSQLLVKDTLCFENRYLHQDGHWVWLNWTCPALRPGAKLFYASARDVSERKRTEEEILWRAQHDPLTKLYNRAMFDQALEDALARGDRQQAPFVSLFLIDLNGFKQVNDGYGHAAGDLLLVSVAQRLSRLQRKVDILCRIGGDEFALIAVHESPEQIHQIASKCLSVFCGAVELPTETLDIGCSIGVSTYPTLASSKSALFAQADMAMYAIKRETRGTQEAQYCVYSPQLEVKTAIDGVS